MKVNLKRAAISGIIGEIAYFISMMLFLITHTNFALTLWESMTVIGAIVMLIAFLENNYNEDGSVDIPEALQPYMGGQKKITKK